MTVLVALLAIVALTGIALRQWRLAASTDLDMAAADQRRVVVEDLQRWVAVQLSAMDTDRVFPWSDRPQIVPLMRERGVLDGRSWSVAIDCQPVGSTLPLTVLSDQRWVAALPPVLSNMEASVFEHPFDLSSMHLPAGVSLLPVPADNLAWNGEGDTFHEMDPALGDVVPLVAWVSPWSDGQLDIRSAPSPMLEHFALYHPDTDMTSIMALRDGALRDDIALPPGGEDIDLVRESLRWQVYVTLRMDTIEECWIMLYHSRELGMELAHKILLCRR